MVFGGKITGREIGTGVFGGKIIGREIGTDNNHRVDGKPSTLRYGNANGKSR